MQEQHKAIAHIRSFNRFYTHILGLLNRHILDSEFSLTEARVLLEISKSPQNQANALADRLRIDRSFLSRILRRLETKGLIARTPVPQDSRAHAIMLTPAGHGVLRELDGRSEAQILSLIQTLSPDDLAAVQQAMEVIRDRFSQSVCPVTVRSYRQGDAAYIIQSHTALYRQEYGLTEAFGAFVDRLVRQFTQTLDPACECVLIPQCEGRPLGSIAIAKVDAHTAQLRFFLLEQEARGLGLGLRLAQAALAFAKQAGYRHIVLETISDLTSARAIYRRLGFAITHTHPHADWGREVLEERWEMDLSQTIEG